MAREVVRDVPAAEFDSDGMKDEEGRAGCVSLEKVGTVAFWVPSAEKLYLVVREKYFFGKYDKAT